jgi:lactoylglutathione lyase
MGWMLSAVVARALLTVNVGRDEPRDLGDGYDHVAVTTDDPDGYRIELIEGDFSTPQDPDR